MTMEIFTIPSITCGHCVMTIEKELKEIDGVTSVTGNADEKTITGDWEGPATRRAILSTLEEINYPAA